MEDIKAAGLFVKEEDHVHQVGHCYRCNTVIEPYLSDQWFVRMQPARGQGAEGVGRREAPLLPPAVGEHVLELDEEHPRLVHLAPALVGSPHPGVVLQAVRSHDRVPHGPDRVLEVRERRISSRTPTSWTPGSPPPCGRSPRWAGRRRPPTSRGSTPRRP